MTSLYNIWTVARIEIKTLLRSWFFRIFAGLSVFILFWFNFGVLTKVGESPWIFRAIPSVIPYANLLMLNAVQAIIAVFLASDFLKRDKKLDTTEVVYMRSMANGDYVLGKTLGILVVFLGLNLLVLGVAAFFNAFFVNVPLNALAYLQYILIISLPTLIFIFGLSFLCMVLIRNQAVTFIVLLGYIGTTLFFLGPKFYTLFDYMAFNVPLLKSDIVGFGNMPVILMHRGIYLFLGFAAIFATILLLKRLPQSSLLTKFSLVLMTVFIVAAGILVNMHLTRISRDKSLREDMIALNNQFFDSPKVTPIKCVIELTHRGATINSETRLVFKNTTATPMDTYLFNLNPGLRIEKIENADGKVEFSRNIHLISITPDEPLAPMTTDSLVLYYKGRINEKACYLDITEDTRTSVVRSGREMFKVDKRYGFIRPDYVLLTPETAWYPRVGASYSPLRPEICCVNFVDFNLTVATREDLTVVSQGQPVNLGAGTHKFVPESPIPQLSLAIGRYEKRSVTVDSIDYNLYTIIGHDYFAPHFDALGDTLALVIQEMKEDFERQLELSYAYPRLNVVEAPAQFFSFQRLWTVSEETVQPGMVFLPEKGMFLRDADFEMMQRREDRWRGRSNQVITPRESQARILRRFLHSTFLSQNTMDMFRREGTMITVANSYNLFPNYFTFVNYLRSREYPVLNMALEAYLNGRVEDERANHMRWFGGLTAQEKTSIALQDKNLAALLTDPQGRDITEIKDIIKAKGSLLFTLLQSNIGEEEFYSFMHDYLSEHQFETVALEDFSETLFANYQIDFTTLVEDWYNKKHLPGYLVNDVEAYQVFDVDRTRYQVMLNIWNTEEVDGLLMLSFRTGGGNRGGGGRGGPDFFMMGGPSTDTERLVNMSAGEVKRIGVVLDEAPRMMSINTMISKNIPSTIDYPFPDTKLRDNVVPFDGEYVLDEFPNYSSATEIIVDNEDPNFEIFDDHSQNFLKRMFNVDESEDEEPYQGLSFWRLPRNWVATTNADYYGKYIRSAHYVKAGGGERKVAWNAEITQAGNYDIYCYVGNERAYYRRGRGPGGGRGGGPGGGRGGGRGGGGSRGQLHYLVYHDDDPDGEEVLLDIGNAEEGWNYLGSFYFSAGAAKVELTNDTDGQLVIADAIKWEKR